MKNRLFIALKLPDAVKAEIITFRDMLADEGNDRKWESPEKLHLTLKFLGDVEENKNQDIEKILENLTQKYSKIECELDRFGFFLPRILWVGLKVEDHLFKLVNQLDFDLKKLDFEPETRNFKPHITILRIKENLNPDFVTRYKNFKMPSVKFFMNEVVLMKSELLRSGSKYTKLKNFYLK